VTDRAVATFLQVSENDWLRKVIDTAKLFGWRYAHFRPALTKHGWVTHMDGGKGFPDLVLLRAPRLILAELKVHPATRKEGRPSEEQQGWLDGFGAVPSVESYVWRPAEWDAVYLTLAKDSRP
jgi:hypothetical protein